MEGMKLRSVGVRPRALSNTEARFFLNSDPKRKKNQKQSGSETSVSERPLATRSHNERGSLTKGDLLRESLGGWGGGGIFTGHIKREARAARVGVVIAWTVSPHDRPRG